MKRAKIIGAILLGTATLLMMAGCGGGDGIDGTGLAEISGTAAVGAPIANATVTVKAGNGTKKASQTSQDGKFKADISGLNGPFLMKVARANGIALFSIASGGGTANIHPFTDLIVRNWFKVQGLDVETEFNSDTPAAQLPSVAQINEIEAAIKKIIALTLVQYNLPADLNLISSAFDANSQGFDNFLDHADVVIINNSITIIVNDPKTSIDGEIVKDVALNTNLAQADSTLPSTPENLRVVPASGTEMIVVWNPATDNLAVAGYKVYREDQATATTTPFPVLSDSGLIPSTKYCYKVAAFDAANNPSVQTDYVCATTLGAVDNTAPAAPTNLVASTVGSGAIALNWIAPPLEMNPDVVSYEIYRGSSGNVNAKIASVLATSYPNINLASSTEYCYQVYALDAGHKKSPASNQACSTTSALASNDATPPAVIATNPPNTAVGANLKVITATFSETLDPNTVTLSSFKVIGPSGAVSGAITFSNVTATFVPSVPLAFGTDYQVTLTTAIKDLATNQLTTDYTWRFNTGKQLALSVDDGNHTCARLLDGRVKCWGINVYGQLGQGDTTTRGDGQGEMGVNLPATNLGAGRTAVQIVSGRDHVCARLDNLQVKCWGKGSVLGLGASGLNRGDAVNEMGDNLPAVDLGSGRIALELVAGGGHNCARLDNGRVKCWGNGIALGLGDPNFRGDTAGEMGDYLPTLNLGLDRTTAALYVGLNHTCAKLDNAEVKCWGFNSSGQLGLGDTAVRGTTALTVPGSLPALDLGVGQSVVKMALGGTHSCTVLDNGQVKCWGENGWGQLGLGDTADRGDAPNEMGDNLPVVNLGTGRMVVDIAAGYNHNCALLDNGDLKCWGFQGGTGVLGYGATYPGNSVGDNPAVMGDALIPVNVGSNLKALEVVGGMSHTCARLNNGQIKCWGSNGSGQLGLGDTATRGDQISEMGDNLPAVDLGP